MSHTHLSVYDVCLINPPLYKVFKDVTVPPPYTIYQLMPSAFCILFYITTKKNHDFFFPPSEETDRYYLKSHNALYKKYI